VYVIQKADKVHSVFYASANSLPYRYWFVSLTVAIRLTITFGVQHFRSCHESLKRLDSPIFISGRLLVEPTGGWLYDLYCEDCIALCDDLACMTICLAVSETDVYLRQALLQAFLRLGASGAEIHTVYSVHFFEQDRTGFTRWGESLNVRPIPREYDAFR
jgi:hypothetical protein